MAWLRVKGTEMAWPRVRVHKDGLVQGQGALRQLSPGSGGTEMAWLRVRGH